MVAFVVGGGGGGLVLLVVADEAGAGDDICGNNRFLASYPESLLYNTFGQLRHCQDLAPAVVFELD